MNSKFNYTGTMGAVLVLFWGLNYVNFLGATSDYMAFCSGSS